jgi:hypothetical protein
VGKKQKISSAVDVGSSSGMESEEDEASDEEDFESTPKTTIQMPNSSLQMFCISNMDKYSAKLPKLDACINISLKEKEPVTVKVTV